MRCRIYRCSDRDGMYLYLPETATPETLPADLLLRTGRLEFVMDLELTPERTLARADPAAVRAAIETRGFYLQMPPVLYPDVPRRGD